MSDRAIALLQRQRFQLLESVRMHEASIERMGVERDANAKLADDLREAIEALGGLASEDACREAAMPRHLPMPTQGVIGHEAAGAEAGPLGQFITR